MEVFRWILVLTGVMMLASAYMMGRRNVKASVYHRTVPDGYDPSIDEVNIPLNDPAAEEAMLGWDDAAQPDHNPVEEPVARAAFQAAPTEPVPRAIPAMPAAVNISDAEVEEAFAARDSQRTDPRQAEMDISEQVKEVDLDYGHSVDTVDAEAIDTSTEVVNEDIYLEELGEIGEPVRLEDFEEKLVTVHVAAPRGQRFPGKELKSVFDLHGYRHGQMAIYHCTLDGSKVFSIANMVQPGTFDEDNMETFETPGFTLFMRLPIELDADVAFDFLIREARGLAQELDGTLRDSDRNPLSEQTIRHMREEIQHYMFRTRTGVLSS